MQNAEIEQLCRKIIMRWKFPARPEEAISQWDSFQVQVNRSDMVRLFICIIKNDNVFRWIYLFSEKLPHLTAVDAEFIGLIDMLLKKTKGDLAQGPIIEAIISIGNCHPKEGGKLHDLMMQREEDELIYAAGLVLGGVGKSRFDETFEVIEKHIQSRDPRVRATAVRALRVIFEKTETLLGKEEKIFTILEQLSKQEESSMVKAEVAGFYFDLSRFDREKSISGLASLARHEDSNVRLIIANGIWLKSLEDVDREIEILEECSRDENKAVLERVAFALAKIGKTRPKQTLSMIKNWLQRKKRFEIGSFEYCLNEIGKENLGENIGIIKEWIQTEKNPILLFHIPSVLAELSVSNYSMLVNILAKWAKEDTKTKDMVVRTAKEICTSVSMKPPEEIIDSCFSLFEEMAKDEDDKIRESVRSNLFGIFVQKPRFTSTQKMIEIITDWAKDNDPLIRSAIIEPLKILSEDKIDEKTVVHIRRSDSGQMEITGYEVRVTAPPESLESYNLLVKLASDDNPIVRANAENALETVETELSEKRKRIKEGYYRVGSNK